MPGEIAALRALRATLDAGGLLVAVVFGVAMVVAVIGALRRRGGRSGQAVAVLVAVVGVSVAVAGIAELTLFGPAGLGAGPRLELDPVLGARGWSGIAWRPVIDNVTLFVPLGAMLGAMWCRRSWPVVLAATVVVSLGVESFQWAVPSGRIANTADVLANSAGGLVGVALARLLGACPRTPRGPRGAPAR